jgi:DNA-binding NtrC family response regulator
LLGEVARTGGRGKQAEPSGTLYLGEVWALTPQAQDVLAAHIGAKEPEISVRGRRNGVRIVASASRPLIDCVAAGNFREDLFYRLSVNPIRLPPLRERRDEIPQLARKILARLAAEEGRSAISGIAPAAAAVLTAHDWPGNFHELEHVIFRAVMLCEGNEITPANLPQIAGEGPAASNGAAASPRYAAAEPASVAPQGRPSEELPSEGAVRTDTRIAPRYGVARLLDERGEMRRFEALEEEVIRFAIDHHRGRMSEVARKLGIGRSTLYRKIRDYGIVAEEPLSP